MPLSLNLPYPICYPATLAARRVRRQTVRRGTPDQRAYFTNQMRDTIPRYHRHMQGFELQGKQVLDIGCGLGGRAVGWVELGAAQVLNIDINRQELAAGSAILAADYPQLVPRIQFQHPEEVAPTVSADAAILFDCFEHFVEPQSVLEQLHAWLQPGGTVWIGSIGWYNYMASHCLGTIPIPWCQVLFSERAILRTIRTILHSPGYSPNMWEQMEGLDRWDQVETLRDRPGEPLNMLSLRQVRRVLKASPFELTEFRCYGFSGRKRLVSRLAAPMAQVPLLKELFHSYYTAVLTKRSA